MTRETAITLITDAIRALALDHVLPAELGRRTFTAPMRFEDLGIDSIGTVVLLQEIESRADAPIPEELLSSLRTVGDLVDVLAAKAPATRGTRGMRGTGARIVRAATPADADALWELYLETHFLYPEKLESMGDDGRQARETLRALLHAAPDDYRVSVCVDERGEIASACTYGRFSDTQAWTMHLASARDRESLVGALEASNRALISSETAWFACTFRENNGSVRHMLTSAVERLAGQIEDEVYDFHIVDRETAPRDAPSLVPLRVRHATESDRQYLLKALESPSERSALHATGPFTGSHSVGRLASRLARLGLSRTRRVFAVDVDRRPAGIAVVDVSPPWWNLSNLSTGVRVFLARQDEDVAASLLIMADRWFRKHSVRHWTVLAGSGALASRSVLRMLGSEPTKQYHRLGVPMSFGESMTTAYSNFLRHSNAPAGLGSGIYRPSAPRRTI